MQKMNNGKDNEYLRIDLLKIAKGLIRRAWIIVLSMVLCGGILFSCATFAIAPKYSASVSMYVNNSSSSVGTSNYSISSSEISAAKSLVDTYLVILKTRSTLNEVIERGNLRYTYNELEKMISSESVNNTEVFLITITCGDAAEAVHIANTIAEILPGKIAEVVEGSSVRIVDRATICTDKVSPSIKKYTLLGVLAGMLISGGVLAIVEILDDKIRTEDYLLENYADIPLLTVIPDLMGEQNAKGRYASLRENTNEHGYTVQRRSAK